MPRLRHRVLSGAVFVFVFAAVAFANINIGKESSPPPCSIDPPNQCLWYNDTISDELRIDALISAMTSSEKLSVVSGGSCDRLHVPNDGFNEAAHGVAWTGRATVFPCSMGMGATWNASLVNEMGKIVAREALAKHWGDKSNALSFFAPNINIVRDVRWGRAQETYGEDPFLTGTLGAAYVNGMQRPNGTVLAVRNVAKHYAAYDLESNFAVGGTDGQFRLSYNANVSKADLYQTYLPAFEQLVREADLRGVMCAYNAVNGTPLCANELIAEELRGRMGFKGIVISDCGAVEFMISSHKWNHTNGQPYTLTEASAASLKAGTDLNCGSAYSSTLANALNASLIKESHLDTALSRNFQGWLDLGLFQDSAASAADPRRQIPMSVVDSQPHRELAKQAAAESVILLKNARNVLPLLERGRRIAVVGPNANRTLTLTSNYAGCKMKAGGPIIPSCTFVNPLQGIEAVFGASNVKFAQGVDIDTNDTSRVPEALAIAADSDVVVFVGGLITCQETGDQCIEAEARDRATGASPPRDFGIGLPGKQELLLKTIAQKTNASIVAVIMSGSSVALPWAKASSRISAIVQHFYAGVLGGQALAEVLAGEFAPSGRLPLMIPESEAQLPKDYLDSRMTAGMGRTHRYFTGEPLYRFGYGLGYSTFVHRGEVELSSSRVSQSDWNSTITVTMRVFNRGEFAKPHAFVAIVYVKSIHLAFPRASVPIPKQMMVGFKKVWTMPGEETKVEVSVPLRTLRLFDGDALSLQKGVYTFGVDCESNECSSAITAGAEFVVL